MNNKWLEWATELQSIAQAGLTFGENRYDLDRYEQIRNLSIEIIHEYTDIDNNKIRDLFASETGYQTPKIDIRAAVFQDNKILLVNEKIDGKWALPGGWVPELSFERNNPDQIKMCFKAKESKVFETIFD